MIVVSLAKHPQNLAKPPEQYSMFELAKLILLDLCPPDETKHLCKMGEDYCDGCCTECWDKYLYWAVNGYMGDPYRFDKSMEDRK